MRAALPPPGYFEILESPSVRRAIRRVAKVVGPKTRCVVIYALLEKKQAHEYAAAEDR
jgi:hypothetical protein